MRTLASLLIALAAGPLYAAQVNNNVFLISGNKRTLITEGRQVTVLGSSNDRYWIRFIDGSGRPVHGWLSRNELVLSASERTRFSAGTQEATTDYRNEVKEPVDPAEKGKSTSGGGAGSGTAQENGGSPPTARPPVKVPPSQQPPPAQAPPVFQQPVQQQPVQQQPVQQQPIQQQPVQQQPVQPTPAPRPPSSVAPVQRSYQPTPAAPGPGQSPQMGINEGRVGGPRLPQGPMSTAPFTPITPGIEAAPAQGSPSGKPNDGAIQNIPNSASPKGFEPVAKVDERPPRRFELGSPTCGCASGMCRITSDFGPRVSRKTSNGQNMSKYHPGIDIGGGSGTPIIAAADGKVLAAGGNPSVGYGYSILIGHGNTLMTKYSHLSQYVVKPGQVVKKGQLIGYMGATGNSTGPHLDFIVSYNNKAYNPNYFFKGERPPSSDFLSQKCGAGIHRQGTKAAVDAAAKAQEEGVK